MAFYRNLIVTCLSLVLPAAANAQDILISAKLEFPVLEAIILDIESFENEDYLCRIIVEAGLVHSGVNLGKKLLPQIVAVKAKEKKEQGPFGREDLLAQEPGTQYQTPGIKSQDCGIPKITLKADGDTSQTLSEAKASAFKTVKFSSKFESDSLRTLDKYLALTLTDDTCKVFAIEGKELKLSRAPTQKSCSVKVVANYDSFKSDAVKVEFKIEKPMTTDPGPTTPVDPAPSSVSDGVYTLKNRHSGKCLDIRSLSDANGTKLQQWNCTDNPQQRFRLKKQSDDNYTLTGLVYGKCVSAENSGMDNGVPMIQWDCWKSSNQLVRVVGSAQGSHTVRFTHSSKCMTLTSKKSDNGVEIVQSDCNKGSEQDWTLAKASDKFTIPAPTVPVIVGPAPSDSIRVRTDLIYNLVPRHSNKCLDIKDRSKTSGGTLQQWDCGSGDNQRFLFRDAGGGWYNLVTVDSGLCVSVEAAQKANGTPLIIWECNGGPDQKLRLVDQGNGSRKIRFAHSDKCMDIYDTSSANGLEVHQWDCANVPDQDWFVRSIDGSDPNVSTKPVLDPSSFAVIDTLFSYSLIARHSSKCLDARNESTENTTPMQQWSCDSGRIQKFFFREAGGGYYNIVESNSGKCVSAEAVMMANGTAMILWDCNGGPDQKVGLLPSVDGSYTVRFSHSNKCMDVQNSSSDDGLAVYQWDCAGIPDQDWFLSPHW